MLYFCNVFIDHNSQILQNIPFQGSFEGLKNTNVFFSMHTLWYYSFAFTDIFECSSPNLHMCDGSCQELEGSYECSCSPPYALFTGSGTSGLQIPAMETGLLPTDTYHINHTCVCKSHKTQIKTLFLFCSMLIWMILENQVFTILKLYNIFNLSS